MRGWHGSPLSECHGNILRERNTQFLGNSASEMCELEGGPQVTFEREILAIHCVFHEPSAEEKWSTFELLQSMSLGLA